MATFECLPPLKEGNVYSGAVVVKDTLIVAGGCNIEGKAQSTVQLLDLSTRKDVIRVSSMPRVKAGAATVNADNKVITLGGIYDKQCPLDNVDVFDIESNNWYSLESLGCAVQGPIVIMRDNVLYCGGGSTSQMNTLNTFSMMDLSIGKWQCLSPMTAQHFHTGSFLHNNNLYVIGGREGKESVNHCECFDFRAGTWRVLPSIPNEFCNIFCSFVHSNNRIYVIGGMNPKREFSNLTYVFDLVNEKWEKLPNILKPRADFGAFSIDEKVLIAGGMGKLQGIVTSTEIFNHRTKRWSLWDDLPNMHASSSKCLYGKSMVLISGMSPSGPSTSITEVKII